MNKNQLQQFDIFLRDNEIHFVNPVKDDDKNLIIDFISSLLKAQREDILNKIKNSEICLGCGKDKKPNLSDWCLKCLEEK